MIKVIDVNSRSRMPLPEGNVRTILDSSHEGTRVEVAIRELEPGSPWRADPTDRTQVVYLLDGEGASLTYTGGCTTTRRTIERRAGIYLEPSEEVTVDAGRTRLVLLHVKVPKHTARPSTGPAPVTGYFFEESSLRSLIDEKGVRERTFWVNKETGLSGSWDLQIGRMHYAPRAHSPRHVHHPSSTSSIVPEHFYFIEAGTGEVKHDHGSIPVGPGSLVLIPSGEWHQLVASDSGFDYIEFQAPFDFSTTMDHDPLGKNWYIKGTDDGTGRPQRWVQS